MGSKDPRVDAYIAKSPAFAQPVLTHLRELVHKGCPEVEEDIKWGMPSFLYKGILCMTAAFKQHATFGFWNGKLVVGDRSEESGMGQFGRITSLRELPPDKALLDYIRKAVSIKDHGVKKAPTRAKSRVKRTLVLPESLAAALKKNKRAKIKFEGFSYSHQKEYADWLAGAKREETRQRRLKQALVWIAQGKPQNWKYMGC